MQVVIRSMPRYFFNVHDGCSIRDETGVDLASLKDAQMLAIRHASNLLQQDPHLWQGHEWSMEVASQTGEIFFTLSFMAKDLAGMFKVQEIPADRK